MKHRKLNILKFIISQFFSIFILLWLFAGYLDKFSTARNNIESKTN